jgi:hypothetical protein
LRKTKRIIVYSWLLLFFFIAGQSMVFAHQHYKQETNLSLNKFHIPVLKENCAVCDVMHHNHMFISQQVYFTPAVVVMFNYQDKKSEVTYIQLILASGRAPPAVS